MLRLSAAKSALLFQCLLISFPMFATATEIPAPRLLATSTGSLEVRGLSVSPGGVVWMTRWEPPYVSWIELRDLDGSMEAQFPCSTALGQVAALSDTTALVMPNDASTALGYVRCWLFRRTSLTEMALVDSIDVVAAPSEVRFTDVAAAGDSIVCFSGGPATLHICNLYTDTQVTVAAGGSCTAPDYNVGYAVATGPDGTLLISVDEARYNNEIFVHTYYMRRYAADGSPIGGPIPSDRELDGLATDASGAIYGMYSDVMDQLTPADEDRLYVWSSGGTLLVEQQLRSPFTHAWHIACGNNCTLFVAGDGETYLDRWSTDFDGDGLCDTWEVGGLVVRRGESPVPLLGADVRRRDIYVELDAMETGTVDSAGIALVVDAFDRAPLAGEGLAAGIALHVEVDNVACSYVSFSIPKDGSVAALQDSFVGFKSAHFGRETGARIEAGTRAADVKRLAYYYCVCSSPIFDESIGESRSGISECPGNDFVFAQSTNDAQEWAGTFMHELGHTLGLRHGGTDDVGYKPNYYSVMNYMWQRPISGVTDGFWALGYSTDALSTLTETHLVDSVGIGFPSEPGARRPELVPYGPPAWDSTYARWRYKSASPTDAVDWDDAPTTAACDTCNVNVWGGPNGRIVASKLGDVFEGCSDWPRVMLSPRSVPAWDADGAWTAGFGAGIDELTIEALAAYDNAMTDCNGNGVPDAEDVALGTSMDVDGDGIPDECEAARIVLADSLVVTCPAGDLGSVVVTANLAGISWADSLDGLGTPPTVRGVVVRENGLWPRSWNGDTLQFIAKGSGVYEVEAGTWSGHGRVWVDVLADLVYLGRSEPATVRSLDCDSLVIGAVDQFDAAAVVAAYGLGDRPWCDLNKDGVIDVADSALVAAHVCDAVDRGCEDPMEVQAAYAWGDSVTLQWTAGEGDSAFVSVILGGVPGCGREWTTLSEGLRDDGVATVRVAPGDAPDSNYVLTVLRTAGHNDPDGWYGCELHSTVFVVGAPDTIAPAQVTDLQVGLGRTTAAVSWTAPGDDGVTGTASAYDLRYSLYPITGEASFEAATVVEDVPEPSEAGSVECVELYGLTRCHAYYFALKTRDEVYNWSTMSNVASGTTLCSGYQEVLCGGDGLLVQGGSGGGWLLEGSVLGQDAEESAAAVADAVSSGAEVATVRVYEPNEVSSAADLLAGAAVEADTCALGGPAAADSGHLALRLSSKSDATWTLSGVKLLGVDHGVEERAVLAGESALVGTLHSLDAVQDSSGNDLAAALASGQVAVTARVGGTWDMSLSGVGAGGAALFLEVIGRGAEDEDDARGITVLAEDGAGGWRALTTVVPRDGENRLVVDSLPGSHLRLLFHDEYTVERLAWLGSCRRVSPEELDLVRAEHSEAGSVLPADGGEADLDLTIGPGENLVLTYDVPAVRPDESRDFFLVVRGQHEESGGAAVALNAAASARAAVLPVSFALHQNRPNPFSGTTTVRFDLPVASRVDVSIFDLQGRRVRTLASGEFAAGFQSVVWDQRDDAGNGMRPSVYLCRLVAGAFRAQKTMVLLP